MPTQRLVAAGVFVAIQAIKLRSALEPSVSGCFIFTAFDALFLWILPLFAIPRLTFRTAATVALIAFMAAINSLLFIDPIWLTVVSSTIIKYITGTELSISGTRVRKDSIGANSLGSYVVKYLPELSATLSADEQLCTNGDQVYLHLSLNSTWPESVSLKLTPLVEDIAPSTLNFTKKDLGRYPKRGSTDVWLPIDQPGAYQLLEITDSKTGSPVLVSTALNAVVVPSCPKAWLDVDTSPKCRGDRMSARIFGQGIAPFKIRLANGETVTTAKGEAKYALSQQEVSVPLLAVPGLNIGLKGVQDALGNTVEINEMVNIPVFNPATASLREQRLALTDKSVSAQITINGDDGPFNVAIQKDEDQPFTIELPKGTHNLALEHEGDYKLVGIEGQHCAGSVSGLVEVFSPPPVSLKVEFQQIKDPCAGPSGIDADVTLSGTPPFQVWYRARSGDRVLFEKDIKVSGFSDQVKFKPHDVGTFDYEFVAVADAYRRISLSGEEYHQQQTINELAGASFLPMRSKYCPGETVEVSAKLQGKAPLTLEYTVDEDAYTLENLSGTFALKLGKLGGGAHNVRLTSITDARGCKTQLDVRSPDIHVRSDRATAKFKEPGIRRVTNLKQKLELEFENGIPPYRVAYSINGAVRSVDLNTPYIDVNEPGVFQLISLRDAECDGDVDGQTVSIELISRPSLALGGGQQTYATLCLGSATAVTLQATGEAPFTLNDHSNVQQTFSESEFVVEVAPAATAGPTSLYYWMNDANYKEGTEPIQVVFDVPNTPTAAFKHAEHEYKICQGAKQTPGIPVTLNGKGPFELTFEIENTATGKKFRTSAEVEGSTSGTKTYMLTSVFGDVTPGHWKVLLHSVTDATQCGTHACSGKPVYISISAAPSLGVPEGQMHVCVGDYVDFSLHGHAPFELDYAFEGRKLTAMAESKFRRLSSFPGTIEFDKIRDAAGCDATLNHSVIVHDLPASRITHESQFSIHHGETVDLAFEFSGTPPFTFTYTRSVRGKVVDRKTVSNVEDHFYSIYTQEEGLYEVVELRDQYCRVGI